MNLYRKSTRNGIKGYRLNRTIKFEDKKTGKTITIKKNYWSDGATWAIDIPSEGWFIHDKICERGTWDAGTPMTNWTASRVLGTVLWGEKRWFRAFYWRFFTFLVGGGEARENGMFTLRKEHAK